MEPYQSMLSLAAEHGYPAFTSLQEKVFRNDAAYDSTQNLFIIGQTSSGKTLAPLLIYLAALRQAQREGGRYPRMLFVVPYRALAAQKLEELRAFFQDDDLQIVQSTGEFRQDDDAVQNGSIHIAIVINEKVFKYEARDSGFLSQYDYLVLDEVGLIENAERGVHLDFILAWAVNQQMLTGRPRILALGTPFYDWSSYIRGYRFQEIQSLNRPVNLTGSTVFYGKNGILNVEGPCDFLHRMRFISQGNLRALERKYGTAGSKCPITGEELCPFTLPCRSDSSLNCPVSGKPCPEMVHFTEDGPKNVLEFILAQICRQHLKQGHQILIFINDRVRVKQFCGFLFEQLQDLLEVAPDPAACKQQILKEIGLESDDTFGIMEENTEGPVDYYQAFRSGIAFHSAALPNELRTYVEKKLLQSREMKIVCSTETLAFGVNSSVDVVIVADLVKKDSDLPRSLTANEYKNYVGRAGRAQRGRDLHSIHGYVYSIINHSQEAHWEEMLQKIRDPETLYSCFHLNEEQKLPFFILNLLPVEEVSAFSIARLAEIIHGFPQDDFFSHEEICQHLQDAIEFLVDNDLAVDVSGYVARGRSSASDEPGYCLTALGKALRGYIIGSDDYELLKKAVTRLYPPDGIYTDLNRTSFLYTLLRTHHAENGLNSVFSNSETRMDPDQVVDYILSLSPKEEENLYWLNTCNERTLYILGALLAWCEGASAKVLYLDFGIHYALLDKLGNQIAYLIEIVQKMIPTYMDSIWDKQQAKFREFGFSYEQLGTDQEEFLALVAHRCDDMYRLFVSVFYGINTDIAQKITDYLLADPEDPARLQLAEDFSIRSMSPESARILRKLVVRYQFFASYPKTLPEGIEARNNLLNQKQQYEKDVLRYSPYFDAFFKETFKQYCKK